MIEWQPNEAGKIGIFVFTVLFSTIITLLLLKVFDPRAAWPISVIGWTFTPNMARELIKFVMWNF